jgi:hypothetical protein
MKPIKPITPHEARSKKSTAIPDFVIEAFNDLIVKNLTKDGKATIPQRDVTKRLKTTASEFNEAEIFDNNWLDVESIFEAAGWSVVYDKPGLHDCYEPYFVFSPKK